MIVSLCLFASALNQDNRIGDTFEFAASANGKIIAARVDEYGKPSKIVVKNVETGELVPIQSENGELPNATCVKEAISADGNTVVFVSAASNLGTPNPGKLAHIYSWDRQTRKLSCLTRNCPAEVLQRHPFSLSVANGGRRVLFETLPVNDIASRLFVIDGDKGVQTLAGALGLGDVREQDYRAGMSYDGSVIFAAVQDKAFSKGKSSHVPFIIVASLEKGISNRIYLPLNTHVGGLCVSGNGSMVAFNDCQSQNGETLITLYTAEQRSPVPTVRRRHVENNQSHYPFALAINETGSTIAYQSAQGNPNGEDMIYVGSWPANTWEVASLDRYGNRSRYPCGMDARGERGFVLNDNGSRMTFIGRFDDPNLPDRPSPKLYCRDLSEGKTMRIP